MRANLTLANTMLLAVFLTPLALAQRTDPPGPSYDAGTEFAAKGTVRKVMEITSPRVAEGAHLIVQADGRSYELLVGPSEYVWRNDFSFSSGDQVEFTGSRISIDGADIIVAREITKGGRTLTLRNARGVPLWPGTATWSGGYGGGHCGGHGGCGHGCGHHGCGGCGCGGCGQP